MAPAKEVIKINLTLIKKYFLFFIILFLLLNVFFIKIIFENSRELEGIIEFNKISVKAKDSLAIKQVYGFTENDIFDLSRRLKDNLILFTLPFKTKLETRLNTIHSKALAVNSSYINFTKIKILKGSFITERQEENRERVVVIDKKTAYKIYKSIDVVGMNITLIDKKFKIIGISENNNNFLAKLLSKKQTNIYIPLNTIFDLAEDPLVPYFQIAVADDNKVIQEKGRVEKSHINKLLENMGKTPSDYRIVDHRSFLKKISQITNILIFIIVLIVIYYFIKKLIKIINLLNLIFQNNYQKLYIKQIIKSKWKDILFLISQLLFWLCCIYIVFNYIKFDFHLPRTTSNYILHYLNLIAEAFFAAGGSRTILESIPLFPEFLISLILLCGISFAVLLFIGFYILKYLVSR